MSENISKEINCEGMLRPLSRRGYVTIQEKTFFVFAVNTHSGAPRCEACRAK
jgi:hypothetical protein